VPVTSTTEAPATTVGQRVTVQVIATTTTLASADQSSNATAAPAVTIPATTLPLTQQVSTQQVQQAIATKQQNVQDLSLPVFVNSELPKPSGENPLVIQTGSETRLDIVTVNDQVIQLQDTEGFRLSVSATNAAGEITKVNVRGAIVVERENFITVNGEGFKPNSDAVAWLFSEPRRLGVVRVDAEGKFQESLQIGDDVPAGEHTTQVNGLTTDGEVRSLNLAVELVETALMVTDTTIDPVLIAATGPRNSTTLSVALLAVGAVLGAGVFALLLVARRRRDDERSR